jgi:hypothetical protein
MLLTKGTPLPRNPGNGAGLLPFGNTPEGNVEPSKDDPISAAPRGKTPTSFFTTTVFGSNTFTTGLYILPSESSSGVRFSSKQVLVSPGARGPRAGKFDVT